MTEKLFYPLAIYVPRLDAIGLQEKRSEDARRYIQATHFDAMRDLLTYCRRWLDVSAVKAREIDEILAAIERDEKGASDVS